MNRMTGSYGRCVTNNIYWTKVWCFKIQVWNLSSVLDQIQNLWRGSLQTSDKMQTSGKNVTNQILCSPHFAFSLQSAFYVSSHKGGKKRGWILFRSQGPLVPRTEKKTVWKNCGIYHQACFLIYELLRKVSGIPPNFKVTLVIFFS